MTKQYKDVITQRNKLATKVFNTLQKMPLTSIEERIEFMKVLNNFNPLTTEDFFGHKDTTYNDIIAERLKEFNKTLIK